MSAPLVSIFDVGDYDAQISKAVGLLRAGRVVVLPTETVYGAAGLLGNDSASARLHAIRGKSEKPFTIHLARPEQASRYVGELGEIGMRLMRKLWPGPVSLVFDVPSERRKAVAEHLRVPEESIYAGGSITLRCPDHIVASDVIGRVEEPVVVTVAGSSAQGPGGAIASELGEKVDLVLDAGPTRYNRPSTILHVRNGGYDVVRAGVYDERIIERLLRTTVLFVCSGNTCRSPMAEAVARRVLAENLGLGEDELEKKGINVVSAGSFAMSGARATPQAVEAVRELGADLSRHRSRPLTVELIHQADAIFTMGRSHTSAVAALVPSASEKTVTLDPHGDIEDPIGGDLSLYQSLAGKMKALVEARLKEKGLI